MGIRAVNVRVTAGADDAFIMAEVWQDNLIVIVFGMSGVPQRISSWMRFLSVMVPQGVTITAAWIEYVCGVASASTVVRTLIDAERVDSANAIVSVAGYDAATRTIANVEWDSILAWTLNVTYRSPDISAVIQEVVDRPGWVPGNAIGLFHQNDGSDINTNRQAKSYDGSASAAPLLHIEYETPDAPAPRKQAIVTLHAENTPHQMLAELMTASRIDRIYTLSGQAPFSFKVAASDAQASRDLVQEGCIVVIWSTTDLPPYLGRIEHTKHDPQDGTVEVIGNDLTAILYERQLPLNCFFESQSAGAIALQMLALANSVNPTGVWPSTWSEPGEPFRGTFDASSAMLGEALDDLAEKTGDEWWLETRIERSKIEGFLRWGMRGSDKSRAVYLQEGVHFSDAEYTTDALGHAASVAMLGGGADVPDRPTAVSALNRPASSLERGTIVDRASESHVRSLVPNRLLAAERVRFLLLDVDEGVLADAAQRALEEPLVAAEEMDLTINTVLPWGTFGPGDYVQVVLHSVAWGGVSRRVRVMALEPSEAAGKMALAVRVKENV